METGILGNIIDLNNREIFYGKIEIENDTISAISKIDAEDKSKPYICPPFVDAHVHIESSMLTPRYFAQIALTKGTVATVSDPHEIANVLGLSGIKYMINDARHLPFHFCFGAPPCVPATRFETAGAEISVLDIESLFSNNDCSYLAEVMNFPGVIYEDPELMSKMAIAKKYHKKMDGHAPGLKGKDAEKYFSSGISTDHECFTYAEALEKAKLGVNILIREGSAAKNFEELIPLIDLYPEQIMFCSDDKHPDELLIGHINEIVKRAVSKGYDIFDVLKAASTNTIDHYDLPIGKLAVGQYADFILLENLEDFKVQETYYNGQSVAKNGRSVIEDYEPEIVNNFEQNFKTAEEFVLIANGHLDVIKAIDGQIVTQRLQVEHQGIFEQDIEADLLKIAVVNRYNKALVKSAVIHGFGLKKGAIASSVAHDSHNIVVVGTNDLEMACVTNLLMANYGGVAAVHGDTAHIIPLPIAGLLSTKSGYEVARAYAELSHFVKSGLGSSLTSPFMTLSFMALLVIPSLKLSDLGLFDGESFKFLDR